MILNSHSFIAVCGVASLFIGACAPDSSVGSDSVGLQGGAAPSAGAAEGGSPAGGVSASGGAPSAAGATNSAGATAVAGATAAGGSSANGGAPATAGAANGGGSSAGAGPSGGSGPGGDSKCAGLTGATSCDGFENAAPGATGSDWTIDGGITVDTTKFFRGKKSIKYSSATRAYIVNKKLFSGTTKATNNELWGRYWVLAGVTTYPAGHTVFGTLADSMDMTDPNRFHFVGGSRQRLMAEIRITADVYTNSGQKTPTTAAPPFPVVADSWQCWEFHVTADDSFAFYINGTEVTDMRITAGKGNAGKSSFSPLPVFGQIQLGWQDFGTADPVVSGWIDEVAFGPTRITCAM